MFHLNTEQLIEYWRNRRGSGRAPTRASINPAELTALLPQIFIAGRRAAGRYHLRLVGGFVADLHGCDLREDDLLRLFDAPNRDPLQLALELARHRPEPIVLNCEAVAEGSLSMTLEVMMAPLISASGEIDRVIGLYQPTSPVAALRGRTAPFCSIKSMRTAGDAQRFTGLRLAAVDGRRIA